MGVLSLHNECPPLEFGDEAKAICQGLIIGEEGTSALLKALADCLNALAAMDDTVGSVVAAWKAAMEDTVGNNGYKKAISAREHYANSFATLSNTVERIDIAMQKYQDLKAYAHEAAEAGRGKGFEAALVQIGGADFETMVNRRIEYLRKLKIRIKVLQQLEEVGVRMLDTNDSPGFFLLLMQPIRDLSIAVNELYSEVVRGALVSHQALFRSCRLLGEGVEIESSTLAAQTVAV